MCGIAGIVEFNQHPVDGRLLETMTRALAHRGPDGEGYVLVIPARTGKPLVASGALSNSVRTVPQGYTVGLGHRRLAILDCSPLAHQPMASEDERCWITYNGEIYNYVELRDDLQKLGWHFRSRSDTEVILNAYQQWGEACLERLNGMFAFAIWDDTRSRLFCARDRLGMKPFYYRVDSNRLVFASEIKALLTDPSFRPAPNPHMVHDFLVLGLLDHTEQTCFDGIKQLRPGYCLVSHGRPPELRQWWDLDVAEDPSHPVDVADDVQTQKFRGLLSDAVRLHLRSDVAVGS
jgi:asparagine synthase (glutamine-hydrolysing)